MSTDASPAVQPDADPRSPNRSGEPACPHCGGLDIATGLSMGLTAEAGAIGIKFEATQRVFGIAILGTEPMVADLCTACGTVTRLYVRNPQRPWIRRPAAR